MRIVRLRHCHNHLLQEGRWGPTQLVNVPHPSVLSRRPSILSTPVTATGGPSEKAQPQEETGGCCVNTVMDSPQGEKFREFSSLFPAIKQLNVNSLLLSKLVFFKLSIVKSIPFGMMLQTALTLLLLLSFHLIYCAGSW